MITKISFPPLLVLDAELQHSLIVVARVVSQGLVR